jgi:diguanylate cyclase (GGDEF)-like protein
LCISIYYWVQFTAIARDRDRHFSRYFLACALLAEALIMCTRGISALYYANGDGAAFLAGVYHSMYVLASTFSMLLVSIGFVLVATRRLQCLLEARSNSDPLTGLLNRRGLAERYASAVQRMKRDGQPLALASIDLDFFKTINDSHGHAMGDRVLVDFAHRLSLALRETDAVARFGGEEFIVLLPQAGLDKALSVLTRIQEALASPAHGLPLYTVSAGIACQRQALEGFEQLLERADAALYRAKAAGRNRIELESQAARQEEGMQAEPAILS